MAPIGSRPAVLPALAYLFGIAWAPFCGVHGWQPVLILGLAAAAVVLRRVPPVTLALVVVAGFAFGGWSEATDRADTARRLHALNGSHVWPHERQIEGRLIRAVKRDARGRQVLELRLRGADSAGATVRLVVQRSPGGPTARLDRMEAGTRLSVWCRLRLPRPLGNPGTRDPLVALHARGIDAVGSVKSARLVQRLGDGVGVTSRVDRLHGAGVRGARWIDQLRGAARRRLDAGFGADREVRALLGAMLLGEREHLDPATLRRLRDAGLVHLVAISGLHVATLFATAFWFLRRFARSPSILLVVGVLTVPLFVEVVGGRPPVVRAGVGVLIFLLGRSLGRDGDSRNALALLAAALAFVRPVLVADPAFQLTFVATAGILVGRESSGVGTVAELHNGGAISLFAYLATLPVAAAHFGRIAPIGIVANLAGVPLCAWVLGSGYAAIATAGIPGLGGLCAAVCTLGVETLLGLAAVAAEIPWGAFPVYPPGPVAIGSHYGALIATWSLSSNRGCLRRLAWASLGLSVVWLHSGPPPSPGEPGAVDVIDVGQAQAILLRGPQGRGLLVDAAGTANPRFDSGERVVLPFLLRRGMRRLEVLALSHEDIDHAGGGAALLRDLEIGRLWLAPGWHRSPLLRDTAALAVRRGVGLTLVERGAHGRVAGMAYRILGPSRKDASLKSNDRSLVLLAGSAPTRVLIPGDLERNGESRLLDRESAMRAEVLVLSHHGSRSGTSLEFLQRVDPEVAVVSCGRNNRFGHPHPEVLGRLASRGTIVLRTDRDGLVSIRESRGTWTVRTSHAFSPRPLFSGPCVARGVAVRRRTERE